MVTDNEGTRHATGVATAMIAVDGLHKTYGGSAFAVRDVSFRVKQGEVVGFLGPNGAGKTTTLRVVAGFIGATSGRVTLSGHDIAEDSLRARACVGYMPEGVPLYPEMRVGEYLSFRAELKGIERKKRRDAIDAALRMSGAVATAGTLIGHLSKGFRQRAGLADALLGSPPIVILDEPTSGLDPNQVREMRSVVRDLGKDHAVLFSTHILSEVEATCDRVLVIDKGRLVAEGSLDDLKKLSRSTSARIVVSARDRAGVLLRALPEVESVEEQGRALVVTWRRDAVGTAASRAAQALVSAGIDVEEISPVKATLEDVFADLTRPSGEAP
jgi:ABC-2 type transport system ATP-binding protein